MTREELCEKYRLLFTEARQERLSLVLAPPEHLETRVFTMVDSECGCGILFQSCGGGRRIIRKRIRGV